MNWKAGIKWALVFLAFMLVLAVMRAINPVRNVTENAVRTILKSQGYSKWETYVLEEISFESPVRLVYNEQESQSYSKTSAEPAVFRVYEAEQKFGDTSMQFIHVTFKKAAIPDLNAHLRSSAERYFQSVGDTEIKYSIMPLKLQPFRAGRLSYLMKHTNPPMFSESIHLVKGNDYWIFHFIRPSDISVLAENFIKNVHFAGAGE